MSTKDVFDHHVKCFGEGDLRGILADYSPGAIMFTPDGPLNGIDTIRRFFQALLAEFGKPGTAFSMKLVSIAGDFAYCIWTAGPGTKTFSEPLTQAGIKNVYYESRAPLTSG
jgi:ketosteroid isomerase-like protein